jgi:hypothetical protein
VATTTRTTGTFVTIGDGSGLTSGIWVDHCTFTKSYDGVLDIKRGASAITISWSEVVPAAAGPGSFVQRQFDDLEANRTGNVMYNFLRGYYSQQQVIDIALPQKKGHLIGSNNLEGLHHLHGDAASQPLQGSAGPHAATARRRCARVQPVHRQLQCAHREGHAG